MSDSQSVAIGDSVEQKLQCPAEDDGDQAQGAPPPRREIVRLKNLLTGNEYIDTLHQSGILVSRDTIRGNCL